MSVTGDNELLLRAAVADELSVPLERIDAGVNRLTASVERLQAAGGTALPRGLHRGAGAMGELGKLARQTHGHLLELSRSVGDTMVSATRKLALGLGILAVATTAFGFKAASNFEQTRIALDGMLGSAERGAAMFQSLQELNKKTPFELQDITAGARQLIGFQFKAEQVQPILKASTDIAAGLGAGSEGLQRILLNLGQVQAAGKVTGRELRDFAVLGVPGYALVANILGKTREEILAMGDDATVSADQFVGAWVKMQGPLAMFGGMAEKQMDSIAGLWSNVKDAVTVGLAGAARPLVDAAKPFLKDTLPGLLTDAVGGLGPPLIRLGTTVLTGVSRILPILLPIFDVLAKGAGRLVDAMVPGFEALEPVADELADSLVELVDALVPVMPDLVAAFVGLVRVLPEFVRLLAYLVPLTDPILRLLAGLLGLEGARKVLADLLIVILAYRGVSSVVGTIRGLAVAFGLLRTVLLGGAGAGAGQAAGAGVAAGEAGGGLAGLIGSTGVAAAGAVVGWAALAVAIGAAVYGLDQWLNKGRLSAAVASAGSNQTGTLGAPPQARADRETAEKAMADEWLRTGKNPDAARFGDAYKPPTKKKRPTADETVDAYIGGSNQSLIDDMARQGWRQNPKTGVLERLPGWTGAGDAAGVTVNGPLVHVEHAAADVDVTKAVQDGLTKVKRNERER